MATSTSRLVQRVRRWPRRLVVTIAIVALGLLAARIALPYVVKRQVNDRLANVPGYVGHVDDIGINLLRGAYNLDGVAIYKETGEVREPFFLARNIDFSIAWRELFRGKIVSDIHIDYPQLSFVKAETQAASQTDADRRWQDVIEDIFPIDITHFEITDGVVRYVDRTRAPQVDVFIKNMRVVATGLRNRSGERGEEFPAHILVQGDSLGAGKLNLLIDADPLASQPHFHLRAKVDDVNLPALNGELKAFANVDVGRGTFRMVAEMGGKDGGFQGYVKPFFENLSFENLEDKNKGIGSRIWENIVAGLAWLVKNKSRDQVGTRIPFQGQFGDPQVGLFATISNLFRHGFVRAFTPTIEGTVNPDNVLPTGESADGKSVAEKGEAAGKAEENADANRAGAPTGRPSADPKK